MRGIVPYEATDDKLMDNGRDTNGPASNPTHDYRNAKVCSLIERTGCERRTVTPNSHDRNGHGVITPGGHKVEDHDPPASRKLHTIDSQEQVEHCGQGKRCLG